MKEKSIENFFIKLVKQNNGIAIKLNSPGFAGLPDRLILLPKSKLFFAEIKAPGEKPRLLQQYMHSKLIQLGFKVYVIDSKKQAKEVLKHEIYTA